MGRVANLICENDWRSHFTAAQRILTCNWSVIYVVSGLLDILFVTSFEGLEVVSVPTVTSSILCALGL